MLEQPTLFITLVPLSLILSHRALPDRGCDWKPMGFVNRVRIGARSARDEAIMSLAHTEFLFLSILY